MRARFRRPPNPPANRRSTRAPRSTPRGFLLRIDVKLAAGAAAYFRQLKLANELVAGEAYRMTTRVFVSSTIFDLIDIRAEVETHLRSMGLEPILSASPTSPMSPLLDADTIETCLTHVRQSDLVVVIVNQRYGPTLKDAGYGDISATHLEYQEACKAKKPIRFYARDRLDADYSTWRKNGRRLEIKLPWISENDRGLFALLDEHRELVKGGRNNWYDTFRHSVELKQLLSRDFRAPAGQADLEAAIRSNSLPLISVTAKVNEIRNQAFLQLEIANAGNTAAFNVTWKATNRNDGRLDDGLPMLAPQQKTHQGFPLWRGTGSARDVEIWFEVTYQTAAGHFIKDTHRIIAGYVGPNLGYGAMLTKRRFKIGDRPPFEIEFE
jgi:uncharacterized protein DUF4062